MINRGIVILMCGFVLAACQKIEHHYLLAEKASMTQGEVGNGGHGIKVGEKIYLYDLWELGLEKGPKSDFSSKAIGNWVTLKTFRPAGVRGNISTGRAPNIKATSLYFSRRLKTVFPMHPDLVTALSDRLSVLYEIDPVISMILSESIEAYSWSFSDKELRELRLPEPVHKDGVVGQVVLLANRSGRYIYLSSQHWPSLDSWNQVALILHEAVYSLLPPQPVIGADGSKKMVQNGKRVRQIVGVFSGQWDIQTLLDKGFTDFIDVTELPTQAINSSNYLRVTSTFLTRSRNFAHKFSPPGAISIVGLAKYNLVIFDGEKKHPFEIPVHLALGNDLFGDEAKAVRETLAPFCKIAARDPRFPYYSELEFQPNGYSFELKFVNYQEGTEIKPFIQVKPISEKYSQFAEIGGSDFFFTLAKSNAAKDVEEACQERHSDIKAYANTYFPALSVSERDIDDSKFSGILYTPKKK